MNMPERFSVSIEKDSDGTYVAYNNDDSNYSISGRGDTVAEAKASFMNTVRETVEYEKDVKGTVSPILEAEPEFRFDISSLFDYYKAINMTAFAEYIGINGSLMRHYKKGGYYISDGQIERIEKGLHRLGQELSAIHLS